MAERNSLEGHEDFFTIFICKTFYQALYYRRLYIYFSDGAGTENTGFKEEEF
jgi:hypothetical protein